MTPEIGMKWAGVAFVCIIDIGALGLVCCGIYALIKYINEHF